MLHRLSIRQKIGFGYILALGIAVVGTSTGLAIGDRYFQNARYQMTIANREGALISELQSSLLELQSDQQNLLTLLDQPSQFQQEKAEIIEHLVSTESNINKLIVFTKTSNERDLNKWLNRDYRVVIAYSRQLQLVMSELGDLTLNQKSPKDEEKLFLTFLNSDDTKQLRQFSHQLIQLNKAVSDRQELADFNQNQAAIVQMRILVFSMLLSTAIATLLAIYISQAIARPIQTATKVAQTVTNEDNFDLQAPIITNDEVGVLTNSLNELIQRVKLLLEEQNASTQAQLIQSEKMSSLGRMLAGVAHEINNPINFIYGNIAHANTYIEDLLSLIETYEAEIPNPPLAIQNRAEEVEIDFLKEDLPKILQSMKLGAERATEIIISLKDFSRLDEVDFKPVDIRACIDNTLLILNSRIKNNIEVIKNYGNLSIIEGHTGLLYQVFMNIISNAIDALEKNKSKKKIFISTESHDNLITIKITDNGSGINPSDRQKIFDMFFTTKPRGVGTGLGLAISRQIVEEKHQGTLSCNSQIGKGTEFSILLPIQHHRKVESSKERKLATTSTVS